MPPLDKERFERLRALSPMDAMRSWFEGDFGIGDEPALCEAIRRDPRITLPDDDIIGVVFDAMDGELDAAACFERLTRDR